MKIVSATVLQEACNTQGQNTVKNAVRDDTNYVLICTSLHRTDALAGCGSQLAATASKAADTDCSSACTGNASEACGGSNRLNLFYSSQPVGPQPNPGVNGWSYIGCYALVNPQGTRREEKGEFVIVFADFHIERAQLAVP